jgi:hypothetical protein
MPANSHIRSRYDFIFEAFWFSLSKGPVDKRRCSMQESINGKQNYRTGQRFAKGRARLSAPSSRRSKD